MYFHIFSLNFRNSSVWNRGYYKSHFTPERKWLAQRNKTVKMQSPDSTATKSQDLHHRAILPDGQVRMLASKRCVNMLGSLGVYVSFPHGVHRARDWKDLKCSDFWLKELKLLWCTGAHPPISISESIPQIFLGAQSDPLRDLCELLQGTTWALSPKTRPD